MPTVSALPISIQIASGIAAGSGAGGAYFAALRVNARSFSRRAIGLAIALQAVRFCLLALVLYGLARLGPAALLSGLAGVVLARHAVLRLSRHTP